ncbi:MAG TPA: hypothetical protein VG013_22540 [Gemmataceae bacterium]|nr:hypothetical protein [Gemmataceae bacterium]
MKAIQIEAYGNPAAVVKVVDLPDVGAPVAGGENSINEVPRSVVGIRNRCSQKGDPQ